MFSGSSVFLLSGCHAPRIRNARDSVGVWCIIWRAFFMEIRIDNQPNESQLLTDPPYPQLGLAKAGGGGIRGYPRVWLGDAQILIFDWIKSPLQPQMEILNPFYCAAHSKISREREILAARLSHSKFAQNRGAVHKKPKAIYLLAFAFFFFFSFLKQILRQRNRLFSGSTLSTAPSACLQFFPQCCKFSTQKRLKIFRFSNSK